jgi:ParB-like chromosome segregation protein Spo0J
MKLNLIKPNPSNPRIIKDEKFEKLCKSIKDFPQMMYLRPIVVDAGGMIRGGNMRYKALQHLGYSEIPDNWIIKAEDLTDDQLREFEIKDNLGFGEWDWEALANDWDADKLTEWGLDIPNYENINMPAMENELNELTIKLKYTEEEYYLVLKKLNEINIIPEQAIFKLIEIYEKTYSSLPETF